jgi:hypothetical protein
MTRYLLRPIENRCHLFFDITLNVILVYMKDLLFESVFLRTNKIYS